MPVPAAGPGYLRFLLRAETDRLLLDESRPASKEPVIPESREIRTLLKLFVARGAKRVRLTGDDPAARTDIIDVVSMISETSGVSSVAMSTRGMGFDGRIPALCKAGLRGVNFHLDTLRPERYAGGGHESDFMTVRKAIDDCLAAGLMVKLNTVIGRGQNDDELADFVGFTKDRDVTVRFVEWNVDTDARPKEEDFIPTWELMTAIQPPLEAVDSGPNAGPAAVYRIPDHAGAIGFIPNMSEHFCSECHRIGLTDAGEIVSCVFGRGLDLVRHLRGHDGVAEAETFIDRVIRRKTSLAAKLAGFDSVAATPIAAVPSTRQ